MLELKLRKLMRLWLSIRYGWFPIVTELNMVPLHSYDAPIRLDWLIAHNDIVDCHNNTFTCLDQEGKLRIAK